jgi:hypothetical protein
MSELLNRIDLRFDFIQQMLANHTITDAGCWEYDGYRDPMGYGRFKIYVSNFAPKKRNYYAQRVSYAFHNGVDPGALLVCHKCDNPPCINPDHLFLGDTKANMQDMVSKGRAADQHGENGTHIKLMDSDVLQIINQIRAGMTNMEIASALPVTHSQVSCIRLGKSRRRFTESLDYNPETYRRRPI